MVAKRMANYSIDGSIKFINGMFMFCCWEHRHKFHLALHLKLSNWKKNESHACAPILCYTFWKWIDAYTKLKNCLVAFFSFVNLNIVPKKGMPDERNSIQNDVDIFWSDHEFRFSFFFFFDDSETVDDIMYIN